MTYNTNKRPVETFVVTKNTQQTVVTSGTLVDSDGFANVPDGKLGIVASSIYGSVALNSFVDSTPTVAEAPVISIVAGNINSVDFSAYPALYPLSVLPYQTSMPIDGRKGVTVTKQAYRAPSHAIWLIGNTAGQADAINVVDDTEYEVATGFRGYRIEEMYSCQEAAYLRAKIVTPNFTDLGYTETQAIDWITTKLAWEINRNSQAFILNQRFPNKAPLVAFLISTTGDAGTAIGENAGGSASTALAAGDVVPVVSTSAGLRNITLTSAMATSIKNAALAKAGGVIADLEWTILTVDLADAGSATGGTADMLMLMALDEVLSFSDSIPYVKVDTNVSLPAGFNIDTVYNEKVVYADEGQGLYRQLDLYWKATQGQRLHTLRHTEDPVINYSSPFVVGENYVVYNILHANVNQIDITNLNTSPLNEIICIPALNDSASTNGLISTFDTTLNNWLASSMHNDAIKSLD